MCYLQIWGDVLRAKKPPEDRPELLVSLTHLPQAERISITIMKARNLSTDQDPYVRVCISKVSVPFRCKKCEDTHIKINDA